MAVPILPGRRRTTWAGRIRRIRARRAVDGHGDHGDEGEDCDEDGTPARHKRRRTARSDIRHTDIGQAREQTHQRRLRVLALILAGVLGWLVHRAMSGAPPWPTPPQLDPFLLIVGGFFIVLIVLLVATPLMAGRSPHITYRPEQIDVRFDDIKGLDPVKEDISRSLELFMGAKTFRVTMGGTPRRGLLFEGSPGTGKTLTAKALAAESGVPFLFVSATSFQSMYYGATARKIRSYFKALRKAARAEGGAIGFIEEIDAIAMARGGLNYGHQQDVTPSSGRINSCGGLSGLPWAGAVVPATGCTTASVQHSVTSEGTGGVVNELLVQMQSFDEPTGWVKAQTKAIDAVNLLLPVTRQLPRPRVQPVDLLLIAATNRADNLDPALLRPGRFDRRLVFDLPDHNGRREIIDHFLLTKAHDDTMATHERRDALAGVTQGYSPVMIEHLLDEALINALRRGEAAMSWPDVERARLVVEVGLGQPVAYTEHEKRVIATHEAGHAVVAFLEAPYRRLEVLSIIKRASALGLLAHGDAQDVYTRSRRELIALIRIAMGGQVAEKLFFADVTTGPSSDLQYATTVAAQMIGAAGMSDTLVSFAAVDGSLTQNLVGRVAGDAQGRQMMDSLLRDQHTYVRDLLHANQDLVAALRDALLTRHELIGHEITDVLLETAARRSANPVITGDHGMTQESGEESSVIDLAALERGIRTIPTDGADVAVDQDDVLILSDDRDAPLPRRDG
ncbi:MAG: ATPase [Micrococcales bacterium]|nr:MAG: ATPase [Micrococcales bacterium]PIE25828.1 MAG: ATPase [Micrococcales bacterium]PIE28092.1 MAG: ATPase [Micrococcales bacterium]